MRNISKSIYLMSMFVAAGCAPTKTEVKPAAAAVQPGKQALAVFEAKSGSQLSGDASFTEVGTQVTLKIDLANVAPGEHAAHIHETGDCSSPDGKSAGGHWNPTTENHGKWGAAPFHLGDIGNLMVGPDGKGTITLTTDKWTLGTGAPTDPIGKAIIVHGGVDDYKTQPTGNAGNRIGCAVIKAK